MTLAITVGATVPVDDFLPYVRPHTKDCPDSERLQRLGEAIRDFCRASMMLRQRDTALLTTVAGQRVYPAGMPDGFELVQLHSAWANGCEVGVELPGEDEVSPSCSDYEWVVGIDSDDAFRLSPAPDCSGLAVTGTISYSPTDAATTVPADLFKRWRRGIAARAIWIICTQPQAWQNAGLAAFNGPVYDSQVQLAALRAGPVRRRSLRTQIQDVGMCWPRRTWGCR